MSGQLVDSALGGYESRPDDGFRVYHNQQPAVDGDVEHTLACDIRMKQNPGLAGCFCGALLDQNRNDKARTTQQPANGWREE